MAVAYQPSPSPKIRFEWINESWKLFQSQAGTWIVSILIVGVIGAAIGFGGMFAFGLSSVFLNRGAYEGSNPFAAYSFLAMPGYWGLLLVSNIVMAFLVAGLMRMANAQLRGEQLSINMIFQGGGVYWQFLAYQIVFAIIVYIGSLLCILPGLVAYALLGPGLALVADGVPFAEAFKRSIDVMTKDWLSASLFVFVLGLIYIVSFIPCGLGAFVVIPMVFIILALIYRDMFGMPGLAVVGDAALPFGASQPGVWPPAPGSTPQPPNTWPSSEPLAGSPNPPNSYPPPPSSSSDAWPTREPNASSDEEESNEPPNPV